MVGTMNLNIESRLCLKLFVTIYVSSIRRSLISLFKLNKLIILVYDGLFQLMFELRIVRTSVLIAGLYRLNID